LNIINCTWCKNDENTYIHVIFSIETETSDRCEEILDMLKENHIGYRFSSTVSVMPCTIQFHGHENIRSKPNSKFTEGEDNELGLIEVECSGRPQMYLTNCFSSQFRLTFGILEEKKSIQLANCYSFPSSYSSPIRGDK
ncbi:hypothetical protein NQ317_015247, partial [Molorchus minor]